MPCSVLPVYSESGRTLREMRLEQEIAEQVSQLPRSKQEQVLRFVSEFGGGKPQLGKRHQIWRRLGGDWIQSQPKRCEKP
jgi:hypothetical protein